MKTRSRAQIVQTERPNGHLEPPAAPLQSVGRRLAYGVVIAWIVAWFSFLLVQGICPVP